MINYEVKEGVAVITMDDQKANALSFQAMDKLSARLGRAQSENRAVVLAGREGHFSAGFDLKVMLTGVSGISKMFTRGTDFFGSLYLYPRPLVIACTGHALAGGAILLLLGDERVGARGPFKVGLTEVSIGLAMPGSINALVEERITRKYLTRAVLGAEVFDPETAVEAGFLDSLADPEGVVDAAVSRAAKLAAYPASAYADTKMMLRKRKVEALSKLMQEELKTLKGVVRQ